MVCNKDMLILRSCKVKARMVGIMEEQESGSTQMMGSS